MIILILIQIFIILWNILEKHGVLKKDIQKLYGYFKSNANTRLTCNFIFDYYTDKSIESIKNDLLIIINYFDNAILGHLMSYDKL